MTPDQQRPRSEPSGRPVHRRARAARSSMPVTLAVMAVCIAVQLAEFAVPGLDYEYGLKARYAAEEPWTLLTSAFLHDPSSLAHIGTNMLSLWIFGRMIEPIVGSLRFAGLLIASILAGSAGVLLWESQGTYTVGMSGGIFGLIGGVLVLQVLLRQNIAGTLALLGLNALMPLMVPNISWQGHVGGLIGGLLYSAAVIAPWARRRLRRIPQPFGGQAPPPPSPPTAG